MALHVPLDLFCRSNELCAARLLRLLGNRTEILSERARSTVPFIRSLPARRAHDGPGLSLIPQPMAWRPYANLIDGELSNCVPGRVTGWMRFFRRGQPPLRVTFELEGDGMNE
jgi:hypothetical protein